MHDHTFHGYVRSGTRGARARRIWSFRSCAMPCWWCFSIACYTAKRPMKATLRQLGRGDECTFLKFDFYHVPRFHFLLGMNFMDFKLFFFFFLRELDEPIHGWEQGHPLAIRPGLLEIPPFTSMICPFLRGFPFGGGVWMIVEPRFLNMEWENVMIVSNT